MLLALVLGPTLARRGGALAGQVSPGPLASPHAELEGTLKCTKCHGGGKEAMPGRCLSCHADVAWLQDRARGFHGTGEVKSQTCASCHPEHAGRDFNLIKWPDGSSYRFDHQRTGWGLKQSHAEVKCDKCHDVRFKASPAAKLSARTTPGGWTGLETTCTACHQDVHRGAFKQECTNCHDTGKWTMTRGFSHDSTAFPLTNKHAAVKCDKCHLDPRLAPKSDGQGHLTPVYKPVPHETCAACHGDVHKGQFGATCDRCHSTKDWKQIDRGSFDHEKTRYPLRGKHAGISCAACHKDFSTPETKQPAFQTCAACHRDAHNHTATLAGRAVDCAECHSVSGFAPATFTLDQHRNTRYPLEGKHAAVQCSGCHRKETGPVATGRWGPSRVVIRPVSARCLDCHQDDHGGQLATRPDHGECANCHQVAGWKPSNFERSAHAKLRLALDGRHADIECRACHGAGRQGLPALPKTALGKAAFLFHVQEVECAACHVDPHKGRFVTGGPRATAGGCLACHNTRAFRPSTTDIAAHSKFEFPLEGAHAATRCLDCHEELKSLASEPARSTLVLSRSGFAELRFESSRKACGDCHKTPHGDQFSSRKDGGRCDACHTADAFQPAGRFDHDRGASFSLTGAHEQVPCNRCHSTNVASGHPERLIFRPLSGKCESCHGKESK